MDSDRKPTEGDCPDDEIDCLCPKIPVGSDSLVAERTSSSNCVIEGSCWLGDAADSGEAAEGGCVWIDGSFVPGSALDGDDSLRL